MTRLFELYNLSTSDLWPRLESVDQANISSPSLVAKLKTLPDVVLQTIINRAIGIEIEVENNYTTDRYPSKAWLVKGDGSLRNHGAEYITRFGVRVGHSWKALSDLETHMTELQKKGAYFQFTERCSVHVHVDLRAFTIDQVRALAILYTLFEEPLFNYAGAYRKSNIFATPLRSSNFLDDTGSPDMKVRIEHWEKYCAINFGAIPNFGTVEFRHMEGTCETYRIFLWVLLLNLLVTFAEKTSLGRIQALVTSVKTESQYTVLLNKIFYSFGELLHWSPQEIDDACSDSKTFFLTGAS